ncbi:MAG: hypothetical protein LBQ12_03390, partial [Deltaproteobacteria bacterium]|nr:hypothetical protein [Deltaproteobacteria bacterium]
GLFRKITRVSKWLGRGFRSIRWLGRGFRKYQVDWKEFPKVSGGLEGLSGSIWEFPGNWVGLPGVSG